MVESALTLLKAFQSCNWLEDFQFKEQAESSSKWKLPTGSVLKLNTYVSFSISGARFGYELRDCSGLVVLSGAGPLEDCISAEHDELMENFEDIKLI